MSATNFNNRLPDFGVNKGELIKGKKMGLRTMFEEICTADDNYGDGIKDMSGSALDVQIGGDHYKKCKIQPVEFIEANKILFLEGCVIKRLTRHDKPTGKGAEDINKAIHELQLLLELRYGIK